MTASPIPWTRKGSDHTDCCRMVDQRRQKIRCRAVGRRAISTVVRVARLRDQDVHSFLSAVRRRRSRRTRCRFSGQNHISWRLVLKNTGSVQARVVLDENQISVTTDHAEYGHSQH